MRERCLQKVSAKEEGGRALSSQGVRGWATEEAGFLNTGRKKMKQVGRGLERGESEEKELTDKPGGGWGYEVEAEGELR